MGRLQNKIIEEIGKISQISTSTGAALETALGLALFYFETLDINVDPSPLRNPKSVSASVWWLDESGKNIYVIGCVGHLKNTPFRTLHIGKGLGGYVLQQQENNLVIPDIRHAEFWNNLFSSVGNTESCSACAILLSFGGIPKGVIEVTSTRRFYFREGDLDFIQVIASPILFLVQNLYLQERERQIKTMEQVSEKIRRLDKFEDVAKNLLQEIILFFCQGEICVGGALYWNEGGSMMLIASEDTFVELPLVIPHEENAQHSPFATAASGNIFTSYNQPNEEWKQYVDEKVNSVLAFPVVRHSTDEVAAILYLESDMPAMFSAGDFHFLSEIMNLVVIARDNIDLRQRESSKDMALGTLGYMNEFSHTVHHAMRQHLQLLHTEATLLKLDLEPLNVPSAMVSLENIESTYERIRVEANNYRELFGEIPETFNYPLLDGLKSAKEKAERYINTNLKRPNFTISIECPPNLMVTGNDKITSLFEELMINAAKYADKSIPELVIVCRRSSQLVKIVFKDNGAGFPPEAREEIFKGRTRLLHTKKLAPGTGWGLPSARLVLRSYSGNIEAFSDGIGQGASFVLYIPVSGSTARRS